MADDDARRHAARAHQIDERHANGFEPEKIDLLGVAPTRVVFAKSGRLDERQALEFGRVGSEILARFGKHAAPCLGDFLHFTNSAEEGAVPPWQKPAQRPEA